MPRSNSSCDTRYVHKAKVVSARKGIPEPETIRHLSEIFQILGDSTRLRLIMALVKEELCVCDLATLLGLTDSAISHQLRLMKSLRLVKCRKEGKMAYYSLDDEHIEDLIRVAARHAKEK